MKEALFFVVVVAFMSMMLLCGCETVDFADDLASDDGITNSISTASDTNSADSSTSSDGSTQTSGDAISIDTISWLGSDYSSAPVTRTLNSVSVSSSTIQFDYESLDGWPFNGDCNGIVCAFYYRDNVIVGGKFDWLRDGQTSKSTENIEGGYNGHSMPADGSDMWFMIVSTDGEERTNIVKGDW